MTAHVVALSGGKDSTALVCWLVANEPREYLFVCTPTGNELPDMVEHWRGLGRVLGKPILPVTMGKSLQGLIRDWSRLPNHAQRWCTRVLKIEPYYRYLAELGPAVSYVGLRADEEKRQGMQFPEVANVTLRFPLRELGWTESDVWDFLGSIPGHTSATMAEDIPARTDCAVCYHQTLGEWHDLWRFHPDLYDEGVAQELAVTEHHGRPYTFRSPQRDTWPADLASLKGRFEAGDVPKRRARKTMCRVCSL